MFQFLRAFAGKKGSWVPAKNAKGAKGAKLFVAPHPRVLPKLLASLFSPRLRVSARASNQPIRRRGHTANIRHDRSAAHRRFPSHPDSSMIATTGASSGTFGGN